MGLTIEEIYKLSGVDPWFLAEICDLLETETEIAAANLAKLSRETLWLWKRKGFSDSRIAALLKLSETNVRQKRLELKINPVFKRVDTCAAEFATSTAYMYSTYDEECESAPSNREKFMVLGGGPNRIGQGIEFDYCCVHAALALREAGYETIMVNCNPETVSTDFDTSDRLYFEPITLEDVLAIVAIEKPKGVIVQYGGQTPLKLARALEAHGVPIIGTSPDAIDCAEDRERFQKLVEKLKLKQPPNRTARSIEEGVKSAEEIGYPLVVRPSYVLGGRAMEIVANEAELRKYFETAVKVSHDSPVLLDRFLDDAIEVDVDAICDGKQVVIGGIMQHIEQAGVHSGDSACSFPPYSLSEALQNQMRVQSRRLALELGVVGLMNVQFAIKDGEVFILEVNPRAARTVPFVSKCIGYSLAKIAALCMAGISLKQQNFEHEIVPGFFNVKESVFPFNKFPGVDPILGPEMKSTGEVMGVGKTFAEAFLKAEMAAGEVLPEQGMVFISVRDGDKKFLPNIAKRLIELGFTLAATSGTASAIEKAGFQVLLVNKVMEGRPHIVDMLKNDEISLIINTTEGSQAIKDSFTIRRSALQHKVCYTTTIAGGEAICMALKEKKNTQLKVRKLQDFKSSRKPV